MRLQTPVFAPIPAPRVQQVDHWVRVDRGLGGSTGSFGQQQQQGQAQGQQGSVVASIGGIRIMADELNNSVLVYSTRAEYEKIEATLKRLDLPLTQVLIEASIVEVTLTDDLNYGLQWAFNDSRSGTDYTGRGVLSGLGQGVLGNAAAGFSYTLKNPAGEIRAVLNALSKKTSVKVLASPSLMVLDNHTASIAVGTQTPIDAGESVTSDGIIRTSVQYKDTGVNLIVTPSVNAGNVVTMQVDQSVTDVGAQGSTGGSGAASQPTFLQRQLSSKLAVRSGESIVMGGLIQTNSSTTKSGVPVLHKIPVIGNLFGSTLDTGVRTELLVVITPAWCVAILIFARSATTCETVCAAWPSAGSSAHRCASLATINLSSSQPLATASLSPRRGHAISLMLV